MNIKVGFGFDVHPLEEERDFYLGGVKLNYSKGATGHSDADVLIHAICDALLGAAGLRDIGFHFPNTSDEYKNADSKILLSNVMTLLKQQNYSVGNADCTIVLENPKINIYVDDMKKVLSRILEINISDISIKATTNEKMGFVGREEGVCAYSVVLIEKQQL